MSSALVSSCDCGARMNGGAVIRDRSMPPMALRTNDVNDDFSLSGTKPVARLDSSSTAWEKGKKGQGGENGGRF